MSSICQSCSIVDLAFPRKLFCVSSGLNHLPVIPKTVHTPVGKEYEGVAFQGRICGVSIMRGSFDPQDPQNRLSTGVLIVHNLSWRGEGTA